MIFQLHYQPIKELKPTTMVSQTEISDDLPSEECTKRLQNWIKDVHFRHPLPEGMSWMCCDETSEYFWMAENQGVE
jgi:hypothetical protein